MNTPDFGPFDNRFRDFSKPWYNDHAFALCINAIETLIGENTTEFFNMSDKKDLSRRCVEIGTKFNIPVFYVTRMSAVGIELQKLILALEDKNLFTHSQLEERYYSLMR